MSPPRCFGLILLAAISSVSLWGNPDPRAEDVFRKYADRIARVRVMEKDSDEKSTVGSGFFVGPGCVATNYHVVADLLWQPKKYHAELVLNNGKTSSAELIQLDVVHDLALLRVKDNLPKFSLELKQPPKGARLFALGNPHDLGLTVVEGTFSGRLEESLFHKLHFTGSVNPGMSGGPVVDGQGRVVGVSVQTAGNQVSFLVPASFLADLLRQPLPDPSPKSLFDLIRRQLLDHQSKTYSVILSTPLAQTALGPFRVPGRLSPAVNCWARSADLEDQPYESVTSQCSAEDEVFLRDGLSTGSLDFHHVGVTNKGLNMFQFSALQSRQGLGSRGMGLGDRDTDFSRTVCRSALARAGTVPVKTNVCLRSYVKFPGLYDLDLTVVTLQNSKNAVTGSYYLTGVTVDTAEAFMKRTLESYQWKP